MYATFTKSIRIKDELLNYSPKLADIGEMNVKLNQMGIPSIYLELVLLEDSKEGVLELAYLYNKLEKMIKPDIAEVVIKYSLSDEIADRIYGMYPAPDDITVLGTDLSWDDEKQVFYVQYSQNKVTKKEDINKYGKWPTPTLMKIYYRLIQYYILRDFKKY